MRFVPKYYADNCCNGLLRPSYSQFDEQTKLVSSAVSFPEYAWADRGDMPIVKWDSAFEKWLSKREEKANEYEERNISLLPWDIHKAGGFKGVLNWNQGSLPSCALHGATHAFQNATLIAIALGSPLTYESVNPLYPFYIAKGGSLSGGLDLISSAKQINSGQYPSALVGQDNLRVDSSNISKYKEQSREHQSGIVFIEDNIAEKAILACKCLCSVCFGSGVYYTSATTDKNGIKVMNGTGFGGHAQCLVGYRKVRGTEYVFLENSWGGKYGTSSEGDPSFGAWITRSQCESLLSGAGAYGNPFVSFSEGHFGDPKLYNSFDLPRHNSSWIR